MDFYFFSSQGKAPLGLIQFVSILLAVLVPGDAGIPAPKLHREPQIVPLSYLLHGSFEQILGTVSPAVGPSSLATRAKTGRDAQSFAL